MYILATAQNTKRLIYPSRTFDMFDNKTPTPRMLQTSHVSEQSVLPLVCKSLTLVLVASHPRYWGKSPDSDDMFF